MNEGSGCGALIVLALILLFGVVIVRALVFGCNEGAGTCNSPWVEDRPPDCSKYQDDFYKHRYCQEQPDPGPN